MSMEQLLLSLRPTVCFFSNAIMGRSKLSDSQEGSGLRHSDKMFEVLILFPLLFFFSR